jgi:hypothetical protein
MNPQKFLFCVLALRFLARRVTSNSAVDFSTQLVIAPQFVGELPSFLREFPAAKPLNCFDDLHQSLSFPVLAHGKGVVAAVPWELSLYIDSLLVSRQPACPVLGALGAESLYDLFVYNEAQVIEFLAMCHQLEASMRPISMGEVRFLFSALASRCWERFVVVSGENLNN